MGNFYLSGSPRIQHFSKRIQNFHQAAGWIFFLMASFFQYNPMHMKKLGKNDANKLNILNEGYPFTSNSPESHQGGLFPMYITIKSVQTLGKMVFENFPCFFFFI